MFEPYDVPHMGFIVEIYVLLIVVNLITSQTHCRSDMWGQDRIFPKCFHLHARPGAYEDFFKDFIFIFNCVNVH